MNDDSLNYYINVFAGPVTVFYCTMTLDTDSPHQSFLLSKVRSSHTGLLGRQNETQHHGEGKGYAGETVGQARDILCPNTAYHCS